MLESPLPNEILPTNRSDWSADSLAFPPSASVWRATISSTSKACAAQPSISREPTRIGTDGKRRFDAAQLRQTRRAQILISRQATPGTYCRKRFSPGRLRKNFDGIPGSPGGVPFVPVDPGEFDTSI